MPRKKKRPSTAEELMDLVRQSRANVEELDKDLRRIFSGGDRTPHAKENEK